ncbi:MAG TPA: winged helix-turn-helix domain-containing protein, partial [Pyrinomonadaceae bacterium]|nr:winged helix-turn-helix domain-containing protein [Pyrinomonadaceae bacterium]
MMSSDLSSKFHQINLNMREFSERRVFEFENFQLDAENLLLFCDGEQLPLTPKVVATLLALVERHGEVVTKDDLMEIVWPDTQVEEGNLTQNLYILRKALGSSTDGVPFIETLRRRGYRFSADVSLVQSRPRKSESALPPVTVERKENIYSVVDWRRDGRDVSADSIEPTLQPVETVAGIVRRGWIYPALALLSVIIPGLLVFAMFRTPPGRASLNAGSELTFLQLTDGRDVNEATISANGAYFTYHETDTGVSRMWVQQVGHSTAVEVVPATTKVILSKTFSPDGQFIYFLAAEKDAAVTSLYRIPTLGGVQTKILEDLHSTVAVSPDGRQLAFTRSARDAKRSEIIVADSNGANQQTILTGHERRLIWGGLAWSSDGNSIAFGEVDMKNPTDVGNCTISAIDPKSKIVRELSVDKWDNCGRMEWTPDGNGLLFIGTKHREGLTTRRDQLFYLSIETKEARRLTTDGNRHQGSSLGVTREGAVLIVPFNRSSQLWMMDARGDSNTARQITTGQGDGRAGIAPLPDGRIGYIARAGDALAICTVNADGTDARQISAEPGQVEELRASAAGNYFYFSSRATGKPRLLRSKVDGSDLVQALDDESFNVDSSISTDGNWIAYNSAIGDGDSLAHTLRLAPVGGGPFVQLTNEFSLTPNFSPDGQNLSFIGRDDTISVVSVPGGNLVATFQPQQLPILNIGARWTPDGKALAYIVRQKAVGNIWIQPLDKSPPKPLTDFSSGEIYNFAFSADGQKLILARGYPTRNV